MRARAPSPVAVGIGHLVRRVEIVHCIEHRGSFVVHLHAAVHAIHHVGTDRKVEPVFQYLGRKQRTNVQAIHVAAFDDTFAVHIVHAAHVVGLLRPAVDGNIVVVAEARAQHFLLPISVSAAVISIAEPVLGNEIANVLCRSYVQSLRYSVETYIAVVAHIRAFATVLSALCGDDDDAIGSFRTVDCRGRCVTQHVDALDIVGRNHGYVHAGNAVYHIIGLHGRTTT